MAKTSMFKLGGVALLLLWLVFGDAKPTHKFALVAAVVVIYQAVRRAKGQHKLQEDARQGMLNLITQNGFKPD